MKNKPILLLLALMLCVGAFAFPITAYADAPADTTPPTLTAKVTEGVLHIEASDAESGVEAVFVGGARINYRVDGALDVILRDYAGTGETVKLYATDFAGNKSKEVQVKNPYYVKPTPAPAQPAETPAPQPTEAAVSEQKPFTPAGSATTVDNATDGDGKEFFTITTLDENIFYLIIDRQRETENVYFLNAVTEEDLLALAQKKDGGTPGESAVPTPNPTPQPEPAPTPAPDPEPEKPADKDNGGTLIFILLAAAAAGGAGYYFKILKPKQQSQEPDEFDEDESELEEDFPYPEEDDVFSDPAPEDEK